MSLRDYRKIGQKNVIVGEKKRLLEFASQDLSIILPGTLRV